MPMIEELQKSGQVLFKWRSYAPLTFIVVFFMALPEFAKGGYYCDIAFEIAALSTGLLGVAIRAITVGCAFGGTSGRESKLTTQKLNTTGMYSIVRNPLYLGNFFMYLAPVIFLRVWWVGLVFILIFILYYERIIFAEEHFLREKFGEEYVSWASMTPMLVPSFSQWVKPSLPFSWRIALSREYHGVYGLIVTLGILEVGTDYLSTHKLRIEDTYWIVLLSCATLFYLSMIFLVKRTQMFRV